MARGPHHGPRQASDRLITPDDVRGHLDTLDSALHYSVVWYFQEIARRLSELREAESARRFDTGNHDTTSGLTSFWLGGSLAISPEEQERFLIRLFDNSLPVAADAADQVRQGLVQPTGEIHERVRRAAVGLAARALGEAGVL